MNAKRVLTLCAIMAAGQMLTACTGQELRQSMGMQRNQPDAFQVVKRPPLHVPPVYHLRPPADEPLNVVPADERAEALVLKGEELPSRRLPSDDPAYMADSGVMSVESSSIGTQGDSVLLSNAGADVAQANIRSILNEETRAYVAEKKEEENSLIEKINPFERKDGDPTVDAKLEAERLAKAKADGTPLNEGEVPEIDPKQQGLF